MTSFEVLHKWRTFDVQLDVTVFFCHSSPLLSNFLMFPYSMTPSFG
jgi:hypothetical protein